MAETFLYPSFAVMRARMVYKQEINRKHVEKEREMHEGDVKRRRTE